MLMTQRRAHVDPEAADATIDGVPGCPRYVPGLMAELTEITSGCCGSPKVPSPWTTAAWSWSRSGSGAASQASSPTAPRRRSRRGARRSQRCGGGTGRRLLPVQQRGRAALLSRPAGCCCRGRRPRALPRRPDPAGRSASGEVTDLYTECDGGPLRRPTISSSMPTAGSGSPTTASDTSDRRTGPGIYYALPDGTSITEVVFPVDSPNGIGLSPDGGTMYWAETYYGRVSGRTVTGPGELAGRPVRSKRLPRRPARDAAPRLAGRRRCRQRVRGDARQRRDHRHRARRRGAGARAHRRRPHDQHLLRRAGAADGLHHGVRHRPAAVDALAPTGLRLAHHA